MLDSDKSEIISALYRVS